MFATPALVIGMTHDPATPYAAAQALTADLGNARLLTFDADGHFAVGALDPCVLGHAIAYLEDQVIAPMLGQRCEDREPKPGGFRGNRQLGRIALVVRVPLGRHEHTFAPAAVGIYCLRLWVCRR